MARIRSNWKCPTLMVEMWSGTTTLENSLAISMKSWKPALHSVTVEMYTRTGVWKMYGKYFRLCRPRCYVPCYCNAKATIDNKWMNKCMNVPVFVGSTKQASLLTPADVHIITCTWILRAATDWKPSDFHQQINK